MSHDPSWLEEAYDEQHRQESLPLLGEGELSLQDPPPPEATPTSDKADDALAPSASPATATGTGYGAVVAQTVEVPQGKPSDGDTSVISKITGGAPATTTAAAALAAKPHMPPQNPVLWFFHLVQGVATLTAFFLLISQLLPLLLRKQVVTHPDILSSILKVYVALCCLAVMVVEAEMPFPFIRESTILHSYASRGFIYSFIGLVCTTQAYSERVDDLILHASERFYVGWAAVFLQVMAWMMFAMGCLYMLLGVCCLQGLRDKLKAQEKQAWTKYRQDLKDWKRAHKDDV